MQIYIDLKPSFQPQTTEKPTKKPKKSKRDVEGPSKVSTKKEKKLISYFII
jgi:hypothetical protein